MRLILRWNDKPEPRPDRKWYAPMIDNSFDFINKGKAREEAEANAKKDGLENYTIESFWDSEYL